MKATDFLKNGVHVLAERGKEYEEQKSSEEPVLENSFNKVAIAFNNYTGHNLKGSDIALILDCLKKVRQYSNPKRLHLDSLFDSVNYTALWAENLYEEHDVK